MMKYSVLDMGTLRVKAMEMIMGVPEELVREQYDVNDEGDMRIGMNSLLIEKGDRLLLIDPGCATFLPRRLAEEYDLQMKRTQEAELAKAGYSPGQITDILFTHLHFDHGSGALQRIIGGIRSLYPNADFVVCDAQLEFIETLPKEEQASFFSKLLRYADKVVPFEEWQFEGLHFHKSDGHTKHLIVPVLNAGDRDVLFATDLMPMKLHQRKGAWSYYDMDRELLQKEKEELLALLRPGAEIIYYHEVLN